MIKNKIKMTEKIKDNVLFFDEETHTYKLSNGQQLVSVSQVVDTLFEPYDEKGALEATLKFIKFGTSPYTKLIRPMMQLRDENGNYEYNKEEIKEGIKYFWWMFGKKSQKIGSAVHEIIEFYIPQIMNDKMTYKEFCKVPIENNMRLMTLFLKISQKYELDRHQIKHCQGALRNFRKFWNDLITKDKYEIHPEIRLWSKNPIDYPIAGTIDALLIDRKNKKIIIIDWKVSEKLARQLRVKIQSYHPKCFIPKYENYRGTKLNKYRIQLFLYRWLVECHYPGYSVDMTLLVNLSAMCCNGLKYSSVDMDRDFMFRHLPRWNYENMMVAILGYIKSNIKEITNIIFKNIGEKNKKEILYEKLNSIYDIRKIK